MSSAEPPLPVPEDDALDAAASAVVDGVATPDEAALVAARPDGQARVDALRAVAGAVGRPVPEQDQAAAARARAAALDAFAAAAAAAAPATATATAAGADDGAAPAAARPNGLEDRQASVTRLPPPPSAAGARWLPRLSLVAAALFLLLAVGAVAAGVLGDDDAAERQTSAAEVAAGATTAPPEQLGAPAAPAAAAGAAADAAAPTSVARAVPPPAGSPTPLVPVVDGGNVGSQIEVQDLAQRAAAALDSPPDPATAAAGSALPSDVQACVRAGPTAAGQPVGDLRYRAVGRFRATPAVVLAYDRPGSPSRLLLVLARRDCTLLASAPF